MVIFGGWLLFLLVALVIAGIAEAWAPEHNPGGFGMAFLAGLIGAWLGARIFLFGPHLVGVAILPAIVGAAVLVIIFESIYQHRTTA